MNGNDNYKCLLMLDDSTLVSTGPTCMIRLWNMETKKEMTNSKLENDSSRYDQIF